MDEILQKLLESELLSESTRTELSEQWQASVESFKQSVREEVQTEVRAELAESWVSEREQLVQKLDGFLSEALSTELTELKSDVERFRDHEAAQAGKIVEMRKTMAEQVAGEMDSLVDKLDEFLEKRLAAEFKELREDIEVARQNDFGRKIFEAFQTTFNTGFVDEASVQAKLNITESKLAAANKKLKAIESEKSEIVRESKMNQVLSPLSGAAREQMQIILKSVPTEKLEESYKHFISRVLRESADKPAAKPLVEGAPAAKPATVVKTGDRVDESQSQKPAAKSDDIQRMRQLAGLI